MRYVNTLIPVNIKLHVQLALILLIVEILHSLNTWQQDCPQIND